MIQARSGSASWSARRGPFGRRPQPGQSRMPERPRYPRKGGAGADGRDIPCGARRAALKAAVAWFTPIGQAVGADLGGHMSRRGATSRQRPRCPQERQSGRVRRCLEPVGDKRVGPLPRRLTGECCGTVSVLAPVGVRLAEERPLPILSRRRLSTCSDVAARVHYSSLSRTEPAYYPSINCGHLR